MNTPEKIYTERKKKKSTSCMDKDYERFKTFMNMIAFVIKES